MLRPIAALSLVLLVSACGNPPAATSGTGTTHEEGRPVDAPFVVRDGAPGLVFEYRDASGFHTVERIADVPSPSRAQVRVDSLAIPPERRLDPALVYVVDLRAARADGTYAVRTLPRERFEAAPASAPTTTAARATSDAVIVYGASWCGACHAAARFFTSRGVAFVEKDIEREPGAREEMLAKARAAGIDASGIPVIDVRGTVVAGFDPARLDALLGHRRPPTTL